MDFCQVRACGRYAVGAAILLALSACYDEDDKTIPAAAAPQSVPEAEAGASWLAMDDPRAPEDFLAAQTGLPPATLAPPLAALSAHYRESPRMIANRVLQLWQEYPETPLDRLMADLTPAADAPQGSLGPVAQQYRVLRAGGQSHAQALRAAMGQAR